MNKNEFAENLVKEFSVKHPNYSASWFIWMLLLKTIVSTE